MPSVFADLHSTRFNIIPVEIQFVTPLVGGCPKDPKLVEGWMKKNMGVDDAEELRRLTIEHLREMGVEIPAEATDEQIADAVASLAGEIKTQGFKRDADGNPYIESRQIKAGFKESVNTLYAGDSRWGRKTGYQGKGPKNYTAERLFVNPNVIGVGEVSDIKTELFVGHVQGRSTIGYAETVAAPRIGFDIHVATDSKDIEERLPEILVHMEMNGLGAMRSQGYGQFEVVRFGKKTAGEVVEDEPRSRSRSLVTA